MKHWLLAVSLICFGSTAHASPYFRIPYVTGSPVVIGGALLAPEDLKQSEATALNPLLTHSPKDGCLLPRLVCEDWTPLAVGLSMNAGKLTLVVAPVANVLPVFQQGAAALLPDGSKARAFLAPNPDSPVTFSAGPAWLYRQSTNKGYFRLFTGLALHF